MSRIWSKLLIVINPIKPMQSEARKKEIRNCIVSFSFMLNLYRGSLGTILVLPHARSVTNLIPFDPLCSILSTATDSQDKTLLFEIVFVIVWVGAIIIAINGTLLGGKM